MSRNPKAFVPKLMQRNSKEAMDLSATAFSADHNPRNAIFDPSCKSHPEMEGIRPCLDLLYEDCNLTHGTSGAGILNNERYLVGIHNGESLTLNGESQYNQETVTKYNVNVAVKASHFYNAVMRLKQQLDSEDIQTASLYQTPSQRRLANEGVPDALPVARRDEKKLARP